MLLGFAFKKTKLFIYLLVYIARLIKKKKFKNNYNLNFLYFCFLR